MSKSKNDKSETAKTTAAAASAAETTEKEETRGGPSWMGRITANLKTLRDEKGAPTSAIDSVLSFLGTLPPTYGQQARLLEVAPGDTIYVKPGTDPRKVLDMLGVVGGQGVVQEVIKGRGEAVCAFKTAKGELTLPIKKVDMDKTPMK